MSVTPPALLRNDSGAVDIRLLCVVPVVPTETTDRVLLFLLLRRSSRPPVETIEAVSSFAVLIRWNFLWIGFLLLLLRLSRLLVLILLLVAVAVAVAAIAALAVVILFRMAVAAVADVAILWKLGGCILLCCLCCCRRR